MMPMEKTILRRRFNPDNYGMIYCPVCKGSGKLLNEFEAGVVCKVCGGFGLIKKEEKNSPHPNGHNHVYQGLC
jgi:DnaJ-class molecular chaperone